MFGLEFMPKITDQFFKFVSRYLKVNKFYLTSENPLKSVSSLVTSVLNLVFSQKLWTEQNRLQKLELKAFLMVTSTIVLKSFFLLDSLWMAFVVRSLKTWNLNLKLVTKFKRRNFTLYNCGLHNISVFILMNYIFMIFILLFLNRIKICSILLLRKHHMPF